MKRIISISLLFSFLFACNQRLDSNLYNQQKVDAYYWDGYDGEVDFILDDTYKIANDKLLQFPLVSKGIDGEDDVSIQAIFIGDIQRILSDTVILYCHGNKDHMDFYWQRAKLLAHTGGKHRYGVMMFDYRGFGMSDGVPTEDGLYADVQAALDWLETKGLTSDRLITYGFSLGSAPASKIAIATSGIRPSKLILEAPFASSQQMVRDASLMEMPVSFFTDAKIDVAANVKQLKIPFCWIHGDKDDFLSMETHGRQVYNNYAGPYGEAHIISGAGHSSVPQTIGFKTYSDILYKFISRK
jgi:pimeloyl-ACP methyl ester carboxylesterase